MTEELFVPKLGQTVDEVVLLNWLVDDNAKVDIGDPVLEVETDKAIFDVEANAKGYIHFGPHKMGETVPVLTVVATIGKEDEDFSPSKEVTPTEIPAEEPQIQEGSEPKKPDQKLPEEAAESAEREKIFASPRAQKLANEKGVDLSQVTPTGGDGVRVIEKDVIDYLDQKPKATPIAEAMAAEMGIDISTIQGSGPKGCVTKSDVESAIREKLTSAELPPKISMPSVPYADLDVIESEPIQSVRKIIFERMGSSVHTTARVTLVTEADATDLVATRERFKGVISEKWGFTPGYNDLIGFIVAHTLHEMPYMNARLSQDGNAIEVLGEVNLGIAVDTDRGLIVPVIQGADQKNLREFGTALRELVERALAGRSHPDDLVGGTFTITNLGYLDVDAFTPVINLPQAAILGIGRIQDKVVPYQGEIKIRKMITLSLVFDHRLIDGAPAARFLQQIKQKVENPLLLLG